MLVHFVPDPESHCWSYQRKKKKEQFGGSYALSNTCVILRVDSSYLKHSVICASIVAGKIKFGILHFNCCEPVSAHSW